MALDQDGLEALGFAGFVTFADLLATGLADVPEEDGVYVVIRTQSGPPSFGEVSVGGRFKGEDPTVSVGTLSAKWVDGAAVLYVGKAPRNEQGKRGLRTRIGEYARFGDGKPIGHRGGRYVWQLEERRTLLVAWRVCDDRCTARRDEANLV